MGMTNFATPSNNNTPSQPTPSASISSPDDALSYLINYNDKFAQADTALFRDEVIDQTIAILINKNKPNAVLVGPAGVGKTKIVEDIARRIATSDPSIPDMLLDHTIYELPLSSLISGTGIHGQLEERLTNIIDFATDKNNKAILFIDEIHQLASTRKSTYQEIAQILKPAMARGDLRVIGATTTQEAIDFINDPAFNRRFSRVIIDELTRDQTVEILHRARPSIISHYQNKLIVNDDMLNQIAIVADRYAGAGNHRPDTALTLFDRASADAIVKRKSKENLLSTSNDPNAPADLALLKKTPVTLTDSQLKSTVTYMLTGHAKKEKLNVDELTDKFTEIKGQDEIISEIISRLEKDDKAYFPRTKPLTFLFAGASGVGKTKVCKIIAEQLTQVKPIMLNMTEYHSPASINRIIGSPAGYVGSDNHNELPFDCLDSNPYQVILLDEFEKADKSVQRLFMSAFEEGIIKTAKGATIDFSKSIIIATTNASHSTGKSKSIGFTDQPDAHTNQKEAVKELSHWFDTELLNRFNHIFTFNNLTKDIYKEILSETYTREITRIKSEFRGITLPNKLDDTILNDLTNETYIAEFGARPANKTIQKYIEDNA